MFLFAFESRIKQRTISIWEKRGDFYDCVSLFPANDMYFFLIAFRNRH